MRGSTDQLYCNQSLGHPQAPPQPISLDPKTRSKRLGSSGPLSSIDGPRRPEQVTRVPGFGTELRSIDTIIVSTMDEGPLVPHTSKYIVQATFTVHLGSIVWNLSIHDLFDSVPPLES